MHKTTSGAASCVNGQPEKEQVESPIQDRPLAAGESTEGNFFSRLAKFIRGSKGIQGSKPTSPNPPSDDEPCISTLPANKEPAEQLNRPPLILRYALILIALGLATLFASLYAAEHIQV